MYYLRVSKFCCICSMKDNIFNLSDKDNDGISHIYKLTTSVAGMDSKTMIDSYSDNVGFICEECCATLNTVYNFQQKCLRSKTYLLTYVSQLQTFSQVRGTLSVRLTDIQHELKAENQNTENQTTFFYLKQENFQYTTTEHVGIGMEDVHDSIVRENERFENDECLHIKKECVDIDNVDYYYKENITQNSSMNEENGQSGTKQQSANQNAIREHFNYIDEDLIENQNIQCKNEIDIEENPLCQVKKEPLSDTETPPEGFSQRYEKGILRKEHQQNLNMLINTCEKPHKNEICQKSFIKKSNLHDHLLRQTGGKTYECEICHKKFKYYKNLKAHMRIHNDEKSYMCELCQMKFMHKYQLDVHMTTHTGVKPHECGICNKKFRLKSVLSRHMLIHTGEKPYECEICQKSFIQKFQLHDHMLRHTGEKPHECEICQLSFIKKSHLHDHVLSHTSEKTHECEMCDKKFKQKKNLKAHMLRHTGEKPHECEICNKTFMRKCQLDVHVKTHTGEKPHECEICKKKFTRKSVLSRHMLIHTGEKPYECEICKKTFTQKSNLHVHIRVHTGEKLNECETF